MARLYFAIVYMCWRYGEVVGLLPLCDMLDMDFSLAWRFLNAIETRDANLSVIRYGRGTPLRIRYKFSSSSPALPMRSNVITFPSDLLYRE